MENEKIHCILQYYEIIRLGENNLIQNATEELKQLLDDSNSFIFFLQIFKETENSFYRHLSILNISQMLSKFINLYSKEDLKHVFDLFFHFIQKIADKDLIPLVAFIFSLLYNYFPAEIFQLVISLLSSSSNFHILESFYIIMEISDFITEIPSGILSKLFNKLVYSLKNQDIFLRMTSIQVLITLYTKNIITQPITDFPDLLSAIQSYTVSMISTSSNYSEINQLFTFLSLLATQEYNALGESGLFYFELVMESVTNKALSPDIRIALLQFPTSLLELSDSDDIESDERFNFFDLDKPEQLLPFFDLLISTLCQKCSMSPDDFDLSYAADFFQALSYRNCAPLIIDRLISLASDSTSQGDPINLYVSICSLSSMINGSNEWIETSICSSQMMNIIEASFSAELSLISHNPFWIQIHLSICEFIDTLAFSTDIFNQELRLELILNTLVSKPFFLAPQSILTIQHILSYSGRPPQNLGEIIHIFIEYISDMLIKNPEDSSIDPILGCVECAIRTLKPFQIDFYQSLEPFLISLLSKGISLPQVFQCFGECSRIAPAEVKQRIAVIAEIMKSNLDSSNPEMVNSISRTLIILNNFYVISLRPFLPTFFNFLSHELFSNENNVDLAQIRGEALKGVCSIFAAAPEDLMSPFLNIIHLMIDWIQKDEISLVFVGEAISIFSPGLSSLKKSIELSELIFSLIYTVINSINNSKDNEEIETLLRGLASLLEDGVDHISNDSGYLLIGTFFDDIFHMKVDSFCTYSDSIDDEFLAPLFFAFEHFIFSNGFQKIPTDLSNSIIQSLISIQSDSSRFKLQSLVIMALTRITFVQPLILSDLIPKFIEISLANLLTIFNEQEEHIPESVVNTYMMILTYIIHLQPTYFIVEDHSRVMMIKAIIQNIFANELQWSHFIIQTAKILWIELLSVFHEILKDDLHQIEYHLQNVYIEPDEEDIITLAFTLHNLHRISIPIPIKLAVMIIGSKKWNWNRITISEKEFIMKIVRDGNLSDDTLLSYMSFNEQSFIRSKSRLEN